MGGRIMSKFYFFLLFKIFLAIRMFTFPLLKKSIYLSIYMYNYRYISPRPRKNPWEQDRWTGPHPLSNPQATAAPGQKLTFLGLEGVRKRKEVLCHHPPHSTISNPPPNTRIPWQPSRGKVLPCSLLTVDREWGEHFLALRSRIKR